MDKNHRALYEISAQIQAKTGEDPISYISIPQPGENRIVFQDGTVSLGYAEAVIHAAAILTKL